MRDHPVVRRPSASQRLRAGARLPIRHQLAAALVGTGVAAAFGLAACPAGAVLLTVPFYSQCDDAWGSDGLGTCPYTMCSQGCAVTSSAMLYEYYGGDMDPGELNQCLTDHGGFADGCLIYWSNSCMPDAMSYVGASGDIDSELSAGRPVIAQVSSGVTGMHFVVIIGNEGGQVQINDPYPPFYETISAGGYTIDGLRFYTGQAHPQQCEATLSSAGETVIDDTDACFARHGSYWWDEAGGYQDHHVYTYAMETADPDCSGEWRFTVEDAGTYELFAYLPGLDNSSVQAGYVVRHAGQDTQVVIDQTSATGWVSLGDFAFDTSEGQRVALYDNTGEPAASHIPVRFDALRFVPAGSVVPDGGAPDSGAGGSGATGAGGGAAAAGGSDGGASVGGSSGLDDGEGDGCGCVLGVGLDSQGAGERGLTLLSALGSLALVRRRRGQSRGQGALSRPA